MFNKLLAAGSTSCPKKSFAGLKDIFIIKMLYGIKVN